MKKNAVILFNLGGPDNLNSVEPFLFNLFNDKAILGVPSLPRYLLAKLISKKRAPIAKKIYEQIGGRSPILDLTIQQSNALEKKLANHGQYKCFVVMRCWHPRAEKVIKDVKNYNPDKIILLPLYPQFSAATSGSSINEWLEIAKKEQLKISTKIICCYPNEKKFIESHVNLIHQTIEKAPNKNFKLIFSAHGLPENKIKSGDSYQWQIELSVKSIIENGNLQNYENVLSYQSRVGPLKWIGPSTDYEIVKAAKQNKGIIIVPVAFVSEHSETLVELDIEYRELAMKNGSKFYLRVPALGTNNYFIESLEKLVTDTQLEYTNKNNQVFVRTTSCPRNFKKCPCIQ